MQLSRLLLCGAVFCAAALSGSQAWAVSTYAEVYRTIAGHGEITTPELGGIAGASVDKELSVASVASTRSSAVARIGTLTLDTWARVAASTQAAGGARADWNDGFFIRAPGYGDAHTGTFSGSVRISGTLTALFDTPGYAAAISSATARLSIGPNTGFNGGNIALQGGGRRLNGTDHNNVLEGLEDFSLTFTNVPFTFDRGIDVAVRFWASSSAASSGADTFAEANYTLTWEGLSDVRDSAGHRVTGYTALSTASGFDYARAALTVPEPSAAWLMLLGGCALAGWLLKPVRRRGPVASA